MNDFTCYHISNRPEMFPVLKECVNPFELNYFDGSNVESFSKLVNTCVAQCPTEKIILMGDKLRPQPQHVEQVSNLLDNNYGFVGLFGFGFFGFKKDIFRKIGMMDERFVGGGYEDYDFIIRLKEANISCYLSQEVEYIRSKSVNGWKREQALIHFNNKWGSIDRFKNQNAVNRNLNEEIYTYNLGLGLGTEFLSWDHTILSLPSDKKFRWKDLKILNKGINY